MEVARIRRDTPERDAGCSIVPAVVAESKLIVVSLSDDWRESGCAAGSLALHMERDTASKVFEKTSGIAETRRRLISRVMYRLVLRGPAPSAKTIDLKRCCDLGVD